MPQSTVWVGTVSASVLVPLLYLDDVPFHISGVRIFVGTAVTPHTSNYWRIEVERGSAAGAYAKLGAPFATSTYGLRAGIWGTLFDDVGMLQDATLGVRFTKVGSAADLTGVALAYTLEVR
jgi:hypothetical protein